MITKIIVSLIIMFAVFYVCWLEDAVCSEIKNEITIEHCRLPQFDRKQEHYDYVQREQKNKQK